MNIKFIAIAGPTASGKSSLAKRIYKRLGADKCAIISLDDYYKDWSGLSKKRRININFDDMRAFDFNLLKKHIKMLKNDKAISMPRYSFVDNCRLKETRKICPKPFVIVEGLMPFTKEDLRSLFDLKIYIEIDKGRSLARRIKRDIKKRGETIESVCMRYFYHVLPMQEKYVEPLKKNSDLIFFIGVNDNGALKKVDKILGTFIERSK